MHAITASHLRDTADAGPPVMRQRLGRAVTQWSVTKAEWIKLRSVRVNVIGIGAAAVALVLLGVLFSALAPTDMGPGGTATDSVSLAFGGTSLSQLIIGVLAALFVGSEYASGLIRTTFGAVARRTRVLRAKAIVFGGATGLAMMLGAFGARAEKSTPSSTSATAAAPMPTTLTRTDRSLIHSALVTDHWVTARPRRWRMTGGLASAVSRMCEAGMACMSGGPSLRDGRMRVVRLVLHRLLGESHEDPFE